MTLLGLLGRGPAAAPTGSGRADLAAAETLLRGLADRENRVQGVQGEAVVRGFYAPRHWDRLVTGMAAWQEQLNRGHAGDRDLYVARFHLGRQKLLCEVQAGLWAGGGNQWFPMDFGRQADDVGDVYLMVWGDGQRACRYNRGSRYGPTAAVVQADAGVPACLRGPFPESLGLSHGGGPMSVSLRFLLANGYRVAACQRTGEGNGQDYEFALVGQNQYTREQLEVCISPALGYAPTRILRTSVAADDAHLGQRNLWEWSDFRDVGDHLSLPYSHTQTTYFYRPSDDQPGTWEYQVSYQYFHLALAEEPSLSLTDWRFPLSTKVEFRDPSLGDDLGPSEHSAVQGHLLQAEGYVPHLLAQPLPTPDPAFDQPYTGDEGTEIEAGYQEAAAWPQHD